MGTGGTDPAWGPTTPSHETQQCEVVRTTMTPPPCCPKFFTCLQAFHQEGGLSQEVLIAEHVLLVHHKAEEGKVRVADLKVELLRGPERVQAVVSCSQNTAVSGHPH